MSARRIIEVTCSIVMVVTLMFIASAPVSAASSGAEKTLRIGVIANLGWPLGLDLKRGSELMAGLANQKGGIDIGGAKYKVDLIVYDSKGAQEGARSAAERLILQDKVKFIIGDETVDAWLPLAESHKVLVVSETPNPEVLSPKYKYSYQGTSVPTQFQIVYGWYMKNTLNVKTFVTAQPDNRIGHFVAAAIDQMASPFGFKVLDHLFYPPESTDFGAIATKVKSLSPDVFAEMAGGPVVDSQVLKAVVQSGFKGRMFEPSPVPGEIMEATFPMQQLEGMIAGAHATEKDPLPPVAKEFMDVYKAKYPKDVPEPTEVNMYYLLIQAAQKARSVDPEKVNAVLGSGFTYESPSGVGKMIPRPDLGNKKTVDTIVGLSIKRVQGGKPVVIYTMTPDEAYGYCKTAFGWK